MTSKSGLFTWIAIKLTKTSRGDPLVLLIYYGILTVVFSAVLNNVTAMIIIGSLSAVSLDKLERRHQLLGFLLIEGLLTNVGGLLTLISSVPNIIVGTTAGIGFMTFFPKAAPYVLVTTAITLWMGAKLFKIQRLAADESEAAMAEVAVFEESDGIESDGFFRFAAIMLIRYKSDADTFYSSIDWDLILFFCFLFVTIHAMEEAQVLALIGKGFAPIIEMGEYLGGGTLLIVAAIASSVTDNIPLAAMLAKILSSPEFATAADSPLWWSVIFGANLGGNLTPIGSASTLVAVTIMHRQKLDMSFARFVKVALPYALVQLTLATAYVLMFLT